jgi:hypothetical protein
MVVQIASLEGKLSKFSDERDEEAIFLTEKNKTFQTIEE